MLVAIAVAAEGSSRRRSWLPATASLGLSIETPSLRNVHIDDAMLWNSGCCPLWFALRLFAVVPCVRLSPHKQPASRAKTSADVEHFPSHHNNRPPHGLIDYPGHGATSYDVPLSPHVNY